MQPTRQLIGIVCVVVAIVGGGADIAGIKIEPISSPVRQVLLALIGVALLGGEHLLRWLKSGWSINPYLAWGLAILAGVGAVAVLVLATREGSRCPNPSGDWSSAERRTWWIGGWEQGKSKGASFYSRALTVGVTNIDGPSAKADFVTTAGNTTCERKKVPEGGSWSVAEGGREYSVEFLDKNHDDTGVLVRAYCRPLAATEEAWSGCRSGGDELGKQTLDMPRDAGIVFVGSSLQQVAIPSESGADIMVGGDAQVESTSSNGMLTSLDTSPTYGGCLNNRQKPGSFRAGKGVSGCFVGPATVAGFTILDMTPASVRFDITVWEGEAS